MFGRRTTNLTIVQLKIAKKIATTNISYLKVLQFSLSSCRNIYLSFFLFSTINLSKLISNFSFSYFMTTYSD